MSYNIGQYRRNGSIEDYAENINYTPAYEQIENPNTSIKFYNFTILSNKEIVGGSSYYLKFAVKQRADSSQTFTVQLKNNAAFDNIYNIKSFTVPAGIEASYFELVITPDEGSYNRIVFELKRDLIDYQAVEEYSNGELTEINWHPIDQEIINDSTGRLMQASIVEYYEIKNVLSKINVPRITKIGIQGPPGLMFILDGEEFRIGRSGIFELYNNDVSISSVGFILKDSSFIPDGKDFFIMDYKY